MTRDFGAAVLDTLLPGDAVLPAASLSGINMAGCLAAHASVLQAIAAAAGGEATFVSSAPEARAELLREIDRGQHAPAFKALIAAALHDYYNSDVVVSALGWRPGPPQPAGHKLIEPDAATFGRLGRVKARPRLWR